MASTTQRYPLSSPDGDPIPLAVIRPLGLIKKTFTTTVSAAITIPDSVEILSFLATANCLISFGGTATAPVDGTNQANILHVVKGMRVTAAPTATTFTVIGETTSGILYCQLIDKWAGLALQTQYSRR